MSHEDFKKVQIKNLNFLTPPKKETELFAPLEPECGPEAFSRQPQDPPQTSQIPISQQPSVTKFNQN